MTGKEAEYAALLQCYKSGQIPEPEFTEILKDDPRFAGYYLASIGLAGRPRRPDKLWQRALLPFIKLAIALLLPVNKWLAAKNQAQRKRG